jgi:serine/threonine protein kinase
LAKKYGKWIVKKSLSEGGQGQTFLVYEEGAEDKGEFVLKRLRNADRIPRFQNEIKAGLELDHPNVVRVVDYNLEGDPPYLVTEYCSGGDLSKADLSRYTTIDRLRMFSAISRGVGHAHSKRVFHRDLKPANIFLREDRTMPLGIIPVVGDFGICHLEEDKEERLTRTDEELGNRFCTAPELEGGGDEDPGPAPDVYCLGKLLYWMIAGRRIPRERHRDPEYDLTKDRKEAEIFLIYELLDKMIVYDPSKRFGDANEVADEVDVIIRRILMNAHPIDPKAPQACTYCGLGFYEKVIYASSQDGKWPEDNAVERFGFSARGASIWRIQVCDYCGNVQLFRPDHAKKENRDVWGEE